MSLVKAPLFSLSAKKSISKKVSYVKINGKNLVKAYSFPEEPVTPGQTTQRNNFAGIMAHYAYPGYTASDKKGFSLSLLNLKKIGPPSAGFLYIYSTLDSPLTWGHLYDISFNTIAGNPYLEVTPSFNCTITPYHWRGDPILDMTPLPGLTGVATSFPLSATNYTSVYSFMALSVGNVALSAPCKCFEGWFI